MSPKPRRSLLRTMLLPSAALLVVAGCGGSSSSTDTSAPSTKATPASSSSDTMDPCKLTDAEVSAIIGFAVTKAAAIDAEHCEYDAGGNTIGSVTVGVTSFPSEKDANVIRDGNTGTPVAGLAGAFTDPTGAGYVYRGATEVKIGLVTDKLSASQVDAALIALLKKFA